MIIVTELKFPEVKLVDVAVFEDERGFFSESYRAPLYEEMGIEVPFVQDNHSFSKKGTIRGMHFQTVPGQAKLVTAITGQIYDVFVDIRKESPTFGKWGAHILDGKKKQQLFIPIGFAHGFAVLSDSAHVMYKVSTIYNPETEKAFRYDDPSVGIEWPVEEPILSPRDLSAPSFSKVCE